MNETIISVTSLEKSFKNLSVLKGINFRVARGSIFALLGSNGAGKTTTFKMLSTLIMGLHYIYYNLYKSLP